MKGETRVRASMVALWSVTRWRTSLVNPLSDARWMGARPTRDLVLTKAFWARRASQMPLWPHSAARWSADIPSPSIRSTRALTKFRNEKNQHNFIHLIIKFSVIDLFGLKWLKCWHDKRRWNSKVDFIQRKWHVGHATIIHLTSASVWNHLVSASNY